MKKTIVFLLSALLVLAAALSLAACNNGVGGSNDSVTRMTITLVAAGSSGAAVKEEVLGDETEYYTVSGYSFSEADAAIVSNAEADPNYYTDLYNGKRKGTESYAEEKERFEQMKSFTVPTAVKVAVSESKLNLTTENLAAMDDNGVIDLSNGASNAKTVYIRAISDDAFFNHTELETIKVGDNVKAIGSGAFNACSGLTEIELPFAGAKEGAVNGAKNFGYVFGTASYTGGVSVTQSYNLSGSATYYIPENLKTVKIGSEIGEYAFYGVTTIDSVADIPVGNVIPAYAFYGCTGLREVSLPSTVTEIDEGAFNGCSKLVSVNFAELASLETIGKGAFANCSRLCYKEADKALTVPASVTFIGEEAFANCASVEKLVINGTVSVRAAAFKGLTSLKDATIGDNVTLSTGVFMNWSDFLTVHNSASAGGENARIAHAFIGAYTADYAGIKKNLEFVA
ncbi:MAG: leucine-rich repeat protein [Clostridia bacterium]|nr:leucine-rich repeat protein [Clostridia bacterium]